MNHYHITNSLWSCLHWMHNESPPSVCVIFLLHPAEFFLATSRKHWQLNKQARGRELSQIPKKQLTPLTILVLFCKICIKEQDTEKRINMWDNGQWCTLATRLGCLVWAAFLISCRRSTWQTENLNHEWMTHEQDGRTMERTRSWSRSETYQISTVGCNKASGNNGETPIVYQL